MVLLLALIGLAGAVERLDAHGFHMVPDDGDPLDLLSVWRPESQTRWATGLSILGEVTGPTLVQYYQTDDDLDADELRGPIRAINLGGTAALGRKLALTAALPVWLGEAGNPVGDLRLSMPIGLAVPRHGEGGMGVSMIPFGDLPTGDELHFLGNRGFGGGLLLATGWVSPRWELVINAGGDYTPMIEFDTLRGGPRVLGGAAFGIAATPMLAIRAEGIYSRTILGDPLLESPAEAMLSARIRPLPWLHGTLGGALPLTSGAGAATYRVFFGLGLQRGRTKAADADADGIADARDGCPQEPETINRYLDRDGCPDELANLTVRVEDAAGAPVAGAVLTVGRQEWTTGPDGTARLEGLTPQTALSGTVAGAGFAAAALPAVAPEPGEGELVITLGTDPRPVLVRARNPQGSPVDARIRFEGPEPFEPRFLGPDGEELFHLPPGQWIVLISAPNLGTERRELDIAAGAPQSTLDVALAAPRTVLDEAHSEVVILEQLHFATGQDAIKVASMPLIEQVANVMLDNPQIERVEVQGHTDADGPEGSNLALSQARVDMVVELLIEQGVAPERLVPVGYGESRPIAPNTTPEGKAMNRRVEFVIRSSEEGG